MSNFSFRLYLIGMIFTTVGAMVIVQMGRIQNSVDAQQLKEDEEQKFSFSQELIEPARGEVYDRWGHLLAGNKKVYEIGVSLLNIKNTQTIAETLSSVLGLNSEDVLKNINDYISSNKSQTDDEDKQQYLRIVDFVAEDKIMIIEQMNENMVEQRKNSSIKKGEALPDLSGLEWTPHLVRSYPEHEVASNVLGFYSFLDRKYGHGYFGVEEKYDDILSGTAKQVTYPIDPNLAEESPEVPAGSSIILTIDREIQTSVERILDNAVQENGAKSGTAIVMDPRTGEILAMATTPRMDLNTYWDYKKIFPNANYFNRAVGVTYEPGSVFKILTMAAALDSGTVTPDTLFNDQGYIVIGGIVIRNWDGNAYGVQDMIGCLQHSLNVCLAWVATEVGSESFYSYMNGFGIDRKTNIDLAGESSYPLATPHSATIEWYDADLGTNAFGQGIAITPIQLVTSVSAVANGGKMMAPHVLLATISDGVQYSNLPQVVSSPISEETAYILTQMLAISLESEASKALVPGYQIAGKTGTASIPIAGGYDKDKTNASFIGWGPIDDPNFLVYVWLEEPVNSPWGSVVAAPVFSEIFKYLTVQTNLPPDKLRHQLFGKPTPVVPNIHAVPTVELSAPTE